MAWTWDPRKGAVNRRKHGLSFDTARLAFDDPRQLSQPDPHRDGNRWQTLGVVGRTVLFVVHTEPVEPLGGGERVGRIISARKATPRERRAYEAGDF
jgi:uncharacterized DUF497 family protein